MKNASHGKTFAWVIVLFLVLSALYTYPGSISMLQGSTKITMSDDTDPATLPYAYDGIISAFKKNPSHFFYGSVYVDHGDPENGLALWIPWVERFFVLFLSPFLPIEQLSTALVIFLMTLNGVCMFLLSRLLNWNRSISIGLGIAWAFSAYTRARAKVHMSLSGIYHLPLVFCGLVILAKNRSWKGVGLASICFLGAVSTAHYYIVTTAFISPLLLFFYYSQKEVYSIWKESTKRLMIAALPAIAFLLLNLMNPIPTNTKMTPDAAIPSAGKSTNEKLHPFLTTYGAHPIDYLSGDIGIGPSDINPIRGVINSYIYKNLEGSNYHERANGVRWVLLILAFLAIYFFSQKKFPYDKDNYWPVISIFFISAFGFALSLSPNASFPQMSPAFWLNQLQNNIRVPSRASIIAYFGILLVVGYFLNDYLNSPNSKKSKKQASERIHLPKLFKYLKNPLVFPAIMILGLLPVYQNMPMANVRPQYTSLSRETGECGTGMYFPYASNSWRLGPFYYFLQRLRGSDCSSLNQITSKTTIDWMLKNFPLHPKLIQALNGPQSETIKNRLIHLARCVPLNWIAFDSSVSLIWSEDFCRKMGWKMEAKDLCISPQKNLPYMKSPEKCF